MTAPQSVATDQPGRRRWTARVLAVLAILGPGLIAANAGNDADGILTYASAGAQFGYRLLFLMVLVTVAFVVQEMCSRLGVYTGEGLGGLIREQFSPRATFVAICLSRTTASPSANSQGWAIGATGRRGTEARGRPVGACTIRRGTARRVAAGSFGGAAVDLVRHRGCCGRPAVRVGEIAAGSTLLRHLHATNRCRVVGFLSFVVLIQTVLASAKDLTAALLADVASEIGCAPTCLNSPPAAGSARVGCWW